MKADYKSRFLLLPACQKEQRWGNFKQLSEVAASGDQPAPTISIKEAKSIIRATSCLFYFRRIPAKEEKCKYTPSKLKPASMHGGERILYMCVSGRSDYRPFSIDLVGDHVYFVITAWEGREKKRFIYKHYRHYHFLLEIKTQDILDCISRTCFASQ